jgi:flagellar biosynthesis protein FliR
LNHESIFFSLILPVLAVWLRLTAAIIWLPPFNFYRIPKMFVLLLLLGFALPVAWQDTSLVSAAQGGAILTLLVNELLLGMALGFGLMAAFMAIDAFGHFLDAQAGLSMASLLGASSNRPQAITAAFFTATAIALFFAADLHLDFLSMVASWYRIQPAYVPLDPDVDFLPFAQTMHRSFSYGILMAMPLAALLFLGDVLLAFASRSMPQLNVLFLAFPIKLLLILLGLLSASHVMQPVLLRWLSDSILPT